jgi:hypothetical protein
VPAVFGPIMMFAGKFYLIWFVMLARDFFQLARSDDRMLAQPS